MTQPQSNALQSLQEETHGLHDQIKSMKEAHEQQTSTLQSTRNELKQQKSITTHYIQRNIELDDDCEELREQIQTTKEQHREEVDRLKQQIATLRNKLDSVHSVHSADSINAVNARHAPMESLQEKQSTSINSVDSAPSVHSNTMESNQTMNIMNEIPNDMDIERNPSILGISGCISSRKRKRSAIDLSISDDENSDNTVQAPDSVSPDTRRRRSARLLQRKRVQRVHNVQNEGKDEKDENEEQSDTTSTMTSVSSESSLYSEDDTDSDESDLEASSTEELSDSASPVHNTRRRKRGVNRARRSTKQTNSIQSSAGTTRRRNGEPKSKRRRIAR